MKFSTCLLSIAPFAICTPISGGQDFGNEQVLDDTAPGGHDVHAADLDGDGDQDALAAIQTAGMVTWYENLGNGDFGPQQVISNLMPWAISVFAIDLDGDLDADVLATAHLVDTIAWFENVGQGNGVNGGSFGPQQVISNLADGIVRLHAKDLDGDGDADALSVSYHDGKVAWYENVGDGNGVNGGSFGPERLIAIYGWQAVPWDVYAADIDGDGNADVLSALANYNQVVWYRNLGGGNFSGGQVISDTAGGSVYVRTADFDGDGDTDVLSAQANDNEVSWYENLGGGNFGNSSTNEKVITSNAVGVYQVRAVDLDGDGDSDVVSASGGDDKVAWYENLGGGVFSSQKVISTTAFGTNSVYATDLDNDGDSEVLATSPGDNRITWYENLAFTDCNGNGVHDTQDIADGTSSDCNADGIPDECEIADNRSLDCDLNGVLDSCQISADPSVDCDGDNVLDSCQIAGDPSLDQDGDGVLDSCQCAFANFCVSTGNSTGVPATIGWLGSASISAADLTLTGNNLPPFQFGMFFYGADEWFPVVMGDGLLCIAPPLYRIRTVVASDSTGAASLTLDYGSKPLSSGAGQVVAFSTWRFQLWYRDTTGGPAGSNTTDGLMVTFCP